MIKCPSYKLHIQLYNVKYKCTHVIILFNNVHPPGRSVHAWKAKINTDISVPEKLPVTNTILMNFGCGRTHPAALYTCR